MEDGMRTSIAIALLTALTPVTASAQAITMVEEKFNSVKQLVKVQRAGTYILKGSFGISGNGNQQNPTSTIEIRQNGNTVDTKTFNWQDGPASFNFSAVLTLKAGENRIWVYEKWNERATAKSLTVSIVPSNNEDNAGDSNAW
ncbi:hypothetical protein [Novosphingobium lindaniclasticum]